MKRATHLERNGRRVLMLGLIALVSCLMSFEASNAFAHATSSKSSTQAQKLSKALKACKKQPKRTRAACMRLAKRKYAPHHTVTHLTTPPASATPPTATVNQPTPVTPPPGPLAPAGPTVAELQRLKCNFTYECTDGSQRFQNFTIVERGIPRLGTGTRGDNIRETTWIFPLLVHYDEFEEALGKGACSTVSEPICEKYTLNHHYEERINPEYNAGGTWHLGSLPTQGTVTCKPSPAERPELVACPRTWGGGV